MYVKHMLIIMRYNPIVLRLFYLIIVIVIVVVDVDVVVVVVLVVKGSMHHTHDVS